MFIFSIFNKSLHIDIFINKSTIVEYMGLLSYLYLSIDWIKQPDIYIFDNLNFDNNTSFDNLFYLDNNTYTVST